MFYLWRSFYLSIQVMKAFWDDPAKKCDESAKKDMCSVIVIWSLVYCLFL